jgi:hypothetical protein
MRAISSPAGQAALHGAVFSLYFGLINRHVPVLFISVEMFDRDMNNDIFSVCFGSVVISFYLDKLFQPSKYKAF